MENSFDSYDLLRLIVLYRLLEKETDAESRRQAKRSRASTVASTTPLENPVPIPEDLQPEVPRQTAPRPQSPIPQPTSSVVYITEPSLTPIKAPKPRKRTRKAAVEAIQRIEECNAVIRQWKREGRPLRVRRDTPAVSPTTEPEDEDRDWEVEKLLDVKEEDGVRLYLIKWKGFEDASWEPMAHLNCPVVLDRFDRVLHMSFDWDA